MCFPFKAGNLKNFDGIQLLIAKGRETTHCIIYFFLAKKAFFGGGIPHPNTHTMMTSICRKTISMQNKAYKMTNQNKTLQRDIITS